MASESSVSLRLPETLFESVGSQSDPESLTIFDLGTSYCSVGLHCVFLVDL